MKNGPSSLTRLNHLWMLSPGELCFQWVLLSAAFQWQEWDTIEWRESSAIYTAGHKSEKDFLSMMEI